jgi:hypothetical protein
MGSMFSYFNYAMQIKSKHLQTLIIMKKKIPFSPFFSSFKNFKMQKNMNYYFCE